MTTRLSGNSWALNFKASAYYKEYQTKDYRHLKMGGSHVHSRVGVELHLLDIDERVSNMADAVDLALTLDAWIGEFMEPKGVKDWARKFLKIKVGGGFASYMLSFAQNGNLAFIDVAEKDGGSGVWSIPRTVVTYAPAFIGWDLPLTPQVPFHWLPDIGVHTACKQFIKWNADGAAIGGSC